MFWGTTLALVEATDWHAHDVFELVFCRDGTGLLVLEEQNIELLVRRTILIAPKVRHRYFFREAESATLKIVCVTAEDVSTYLSPAQTSILRHMSREGVTFTDYAGEGLKIWDLSEIIPDGFGHVNHGELNVVWGVIGLLLASHMQGRKISDDRTGARHAETIKKLCEWLDNNLEDNVSLDNLASKFGISRSLLTREFKRYAGTSIVDYVNTRRLQKAGSILASTEKSITEAALESGFSSIANFYKRFQNLYGVTPASFRRQILCSRTSDCEGLKVNAG